MIEVIENEIVVEVVDGPEIVVEVGDGLILPEWGMIGGDIENQGDLMEELDALGEAINDKADRIHDHDDRYYSKEDVNSLLSDKADSDDVTAALALKADASAVYTKQETDTALASKADTSAVYTKQETDSALALKADIEDVDEGFQLVDAALSQKADSSAVYTKQETIALLADKADVIVCEVSGDPVSVPDAAAGPVRGLSVEVEPVQDLHGYDRPWPAGGGKNLMNLDVFSYPLTYGGVTVSMNDGVFTANGTVSSDEWLFPNSNYQLIFKDLKPSTQYVFTTGHSGDGIRLQAYIFYGSWTKIAEEYSTDTLSFTTPENYTNIWIRIRFVRNTVLNNVKLYPMIRLASDADDTYEPYSNICPITGWTGANVTVNGASVPIIFPSSAGTVYGGTLDVMNGVLTVTHGQIASYNGETLPGIWISDRDEYSEGTTPTTGAQVVYQLASPITYTLTPQAVSVALGQNSIGADCGPVNVRYRADTKLYIDGKFAEIVNRG